jgi:hypothetical protein
MNSPRKPSVLFVFYSHTQQSIRVADAMAGVLRERGCDVTLAGIEFTDPHYARKFGRFPFRHGLLDLLTVLPAQVRAASAGAAGDRPPCAADRTAGAGRPVSDRLGGRAAGLREDDAIVAVGRA